MQKTIIYFDFSGIHKAFAKIIDTKLQVICAFIARDGEHLTVHKQKDTENVLFTFYSKNKVPSTWDPEKVALARALGYKDPERHGQYIIHDDSDFMNGLWVDSIDFSTDSSFALKKVLKPIISLRIEQASYLDEIPQKYKKLSKLLVPAIDEDFWLSIFFTTRFSEFCMSSLQPIRTSLGYISFQISPLNEEQALRV